MMVMEPFISWTGHGAAESSPPATFLGARAAVFAFKGDSAAIQGLIDTVLAPATRGQVRYSPVLPIGVISFVDVERCASKVESIGWTPGRECAIWTMLWETPADGGPRRLVLWAPYVFIDYSLGLITGREVWGWPKVGAKLEVASDNPGAPAVWTCRTMIFRKFNPETRGQEEPLISVRSPHEHSPEPAWLRIGHFLEHALAGLLSGITGLAVDDGLHPVLPAIAVKQFRDNERPDLACYQAITNSPCRLSTFRGGGPMDGPFEIEFAQCESHQILTDFTGAPVASKGTRAVPVTWAAWLDFDFEAETGSHVTR